MEAFSQAYYGGVAVGVREELGLSGWESLRRPMCAAEACLTKGFGILEMMLTSQKLFSILCFCKIVYIFFCSQEKCSFTINLRTE